MRSATGPRTSLVGKKQVQATIVVRELAVAQLSEQPQSLYATGRGGDVGAGEGAADEVSPPPPTTDLNASMTA